MALWAGRVIPAQRNSNGFKEGTSHDEDNLDTDLVTAGAGSLDFRKKRTEQSRWQDAFGNGGVF